MRHLFALTSVLVGTAAWSAEGLWPIGAPPVERWQSIEAFNPTPDWTARLQGATVKLSPSCSGVLVSPKGLVLTSYGCVAECVVALSSDADDWRDLGYLARSPAAEQQCPGMALQQPPAMRIVDDLRLVFAPEQSIAATAHFDIALLRAYSQDSALPTPDYLEWRTTTPSSDELLIASGFPPLTERALNVAELIHRRDVALPLQLLQLAERRGLLAQFASESAAHQRSSELPLQQIDAALRTARQQHRLLIDPEFIDLRRQQESELRQRIDNKRRWREAYAEAWPQMDQALRTQRDLYPVYWQLEMAQGFDSQLFTIARHLLRAAQERDKPDADRLLEYRETNQAALRHSLLSPAPINRDLERLRLSLSLRQLQAQLGADHPAVVLALGAESAEQVADAAVSGSRLDELSVREQWLTASAAAIQSSDDAMLALARRIDPAARAVRERHAIEVAAVVERQSKRIATAHRELLGTDAVPAYPDANGDLRLSYGTITDRNAPTAEAALFAGTSTTYLTSHDLGGGYSGGAVVDRQARLIGLISRGHPAAVAGRYHYSEGHDQAIVVDVAAVGRALRSVYEATELLDELRIRPD